MDIISLVFKRLERLLNEGDFERAVLELVIIAKENQQHEAEMGLKNIYWKMGNLKRYAKAGLLEQDVIARQTMKLTELALKLLYQISATPDLKIPYSDKIRLWIRVDEGNFTEEKRRLLYSRLSNIIGEDIRNYLVREGS